MRTQKRGDRAREQILAAVTDRWQQAKAAPTIRDLAAETGLSIATIHRHVQILRGQGRLVGRGRTLRPG